MAAVTRHLNYFLIHPIESTDLTLFSEEFYHDYCRLVSHWIFILSATLAHPSDQMNMPCTRTIAEMLHNVASHLNVLNYVKTMPDLIVMLLRLTEVDHDGVQLNAYRCLGKLMREADIKALANLSKNCLCIRGFLNEEYWRLAKHPTFLQYSGEFKKVSEP